MVQSSGLDSVSQRIQEIQQRLASFNAPVANATTAPNIGVDTQDFSQILQNAEKPNNADATDNSGDTNLMENLVGSQAQQVGLDPSLAKAVAKAESGFNPNAVSSVGAKGLMQLMPSTAQGLGVQSILNPVENAKGGTTYLKSLLEKYHSVPNALAAYNAGPGAVDKYGGVPPYPETQQYVGRVMQYQRQYEQKAVN